MEGAIQKIDENNKEASLKESSDTIKTYKKKL